VENAGTGTLQVTNAENSLSGVVASSGNVEVYNVTGAMSLEELRIATGLSVSLLTGDAGTPIEPANEANVTVVGLAVFEKGATLNANLTMAAGSELRMEGPLHMGSTLELVSGADSITLSGSMYDAVAGMQLGESMTLFTGVDALVLTFDGVSVTYQPGDIQVADRVLASDFFGNLPEPGANQQYFITFTTAEVGGGELAFFMAPEPTTTTLSLLALAALAARRRRK
jgi:MYXO-CTERM domain-containing protein